MFEEEEEELSKGYLKLSLQPLEVEDSSENTAAKTLGRGKRSCRPVGGASKVFLSAQDDLIWAPAHQSLWESEVQIESNRIR